MSGSDMTAVQQSHQVYISQKSEKDRQFEIQTGNVVSESNDGDSDADFSMIQGSFERNLQGSYAIFDQEKKRFVT